MVEHSVTTHPPISETSPLFDLAQLSAPHMEASVQRYGREISLDNLNNSVTAFAKANVVVDERFVLKGVLGKKNVHIGEKGDGAFVLDGQYSFALGYLRGKAGKPLWIAVVSFATGETSSLHRASLWQQGIETDYECALPLIVQIQGPAVWSYDNKPKFRDAKKVLGKLRWEKALVAILLNWAKQNKVPSVYLLPARMNQYRSKDRDPRLHLRYDVNTRRMGFLQQGQGFFKKVINSDVGSPGDFSMLQAEMLVI